MLNVTLLALCMHYYVIFNPQATLGNPLTIIIKTWNRIIQSNSGCNDIYWATQTISEIMCRELKKKTNHISWCLTVDNNSHWGRWWRYLVATFSSLLSFAVCFFFLSFFLHRRLSLSFLFFVVVYFHSLSWREADSIHLYSTLISLGHTT